MIKGSLVAIVTPMRDHRMVDYKKLDVLIQFHVDHGTHGIVVAGTTGESATLNFDEHYKVIEHVANHACQHMPVIAGTGANSTHEAIELTHAAKQCGATACLLVTPYYNKPTQDGLYEHYTAIADAVNIPQILYNVPGRTACDMLPETVARLSRHRNIVGIKEATGDDTVGRCQQHRNACGNDFAIYSGEDAVAAEAVLQGGNGVISVTANVAPGLMSQMMTAALDGDRERAETINARLSDLHKALFLESNPIPVKWALTRMGLIRRNIRLPLTTLSDVYHQDLYAAMRKAGIQV